MEMTNDTQAGKSIMKLALGPLLYYWQRDTVFDFYQRIAASPVSTVYLGEAVCSRRHELRLSDWLTIAEQLTAAGKEVVLSTLALIEAGTDLAVLRKITDNGRFLVEANDMGAVHCLAGKVPFVAGPHLNLFNAPSLELMAGLGAKRWVMPLEVGRDGLAEILKSRPGGIETEVFSYGRMPLAFSARCFTARNRNLPKDDCRFSCIDYPDGLVMQTKEKQPFLVLNGIQTQSTRVYNLIGEVESMRAVGVDVVRISPQAQHTEQVIGLFEAALKQQITPAAAQQQMQQWMPDQPCNGYWYGKPGLDQIAA
jgi:O2-independent ubiquinone biosynthesis protein UbiV